MTPVIAAFVGIGASLGTREAAVLRAVRAIEYSGAGRLVDVSPLYETPPLGMVSERTFVNAVARVHPLLSATDLLERLKTIEKRMGRTGGHMAPREIDLDLIACGSDVVETPDLTLPHPRYHGRAFVLVPLADVAPDFVCPRTGSSIMELLGGVDTGGVIQISGRKFVGEVNRGG